jgi:protoporphyrinogen oxidase
MLVQVATLCFAALALIPCSINGVPVPYDVVIIGGGISGLTTAYELKKNKPDTRLIVLEAGNRVGGRTFSVDMRAANQTTDRFDLGQSHKVFPLSRHDTADIFAPPVS